MYEFLFHLGAEDGEGARQFSFHSVGIRVPPERQAYPHMLAYFAWRRRVRHAYPPSSALEPPLESIVSQLTGFHDLTK